MPAKHADQGSRVIQWRPRRADSSLIEPGHMMMDWVAGVPGLRPLSLLRPSAGYPALRGPSGLTGAGGSQPRCVPHRLDGGAHARLPPAGLSPGSAHTVASASSPSSEDVAGPADDLSGLGQGGALAVLAVLHGGVVAVIGCDGAGMGLAGLIHRPAQHRGALPGQAIGRALRSEEHTSEL